MRHGSYEPPGSTDYNELSDLSDPEFLELEGMVQHHPRTQAFDVDPGERVEDGEKRATKSRSRYFNVRAVVSLLCWYGFSISLSVYNKYMFSPSGMDFHFPILTTAIHQLSQILLALLALVVLRIPITSATLEERVKVAPAALASAADIGLGNTSLLLVTLSFYTMIKSTALGFVLLFSVLFHLEHPSWRLAAIIGVMTLGVFLMVAGETEFNLIGFFLVLGAACSSGLRWALVKIVLLGSTRTGRSAGQTSPHAQHGRNGSNYSTKPHPVQTILALSPVTFIALFIWGLIQERPEKFVHAKLWETSSIPLGIAYILFPGVLAFAMTWAEFELLNATGPLTLAVAGICKEVATIIVSVITFHDKLSVVNTIGLLVTIVSIALYHYHCIS